MKCPHCNYEPEINEFDYCTGAGRFFELGIEAKQEANSWEEIKREAIYGCPRCGIMFMNQGYEK